MSDQALPPRLVLDDVDAMLDGRAVLSGVSLGFGPGECVALIGPNGAGKSTLLRRMAGLLGGSGRIMLDGRPLDGMTPAARARAIAYLPQQRQIGWPIRVADLVALGRIPHGADPLSPGSADRAAITRALDAMQIADWADRPATALSQGEQARVLMARVLATEADILLVDEPIAALDPRHQLHMLTILRREAKAGRIVIAVLHDLALAGDWATRIALLAEGSLIADGAPGDVLTPETILAAYGVKPSGEPGHFRFMPEA